MVHPASFGQCAHSPGKRIIGDQEVGGAQGEGELFLVGGHIHRDDFSGPGQAGRLQDRKTHPAQPKNQDGLSLLDGGRVVDRTPSGEHSTPQDGGHRRVHPVGQRNDRGDGHDGGLGKGTGVQTGVHGGAVGEFGVGVCTAVQCVFTQPGFTLFAEPAPPTWGSPVEDHVLAGGDLGDPLTDGLDGAGTLVSQNRGPFLGQSSVGQGQVGVAHTRGAKADPYLSGAGGGKDDLTDPWGGVDPVEDGGLDGRTHGRTLQSGLPRQ